MRPHSFVSLLALSITAFGTTSCSKPAEKAAETGEAKASAAQVTPAPVNADGPPSSLEGGDCQQLRG